MEVEKPQLTEEIRQPEPRLLRMPSEPSAIRPHVEEEVEPEIEEEIL